MIRIIQMSENFYGSGHKNNSRIFFRPTEEAAFRLIEGEQKRELLLGSEVNTGDSEVSSCRPEEIVGFVNKDISNRLDELFRKAPKQLQAFKLYFFGGLTQGQIAVEMGVSVKSANNLLFEAKCKAAADKTMNGFTLPSRRR